MLASRIIATLLIRDGLLVKGKHFVNDRRVGSIMQAARVFEMRGIDELALLDVDASKRGELFNCDLLREITDELSIPVAVGGGIKTLSDVRRLMEYGADKIVLGRSALDGEIIDSAARSLGSQSVCVSIDYSIESGVVSPVASGAAVSLVGISRQVEQMGAGEILLQSIDRDGTLTGYDTDNVKLVSESVGIPIIASGGAGNVQDFIDAFGAGASACSAGAVWQFTQITPRDVKLKMQECGIPVRL